ncbi:MAG TPA: ABC transporter ATP-binding protein [Xanthobacteraceae bacterium]|nr:ABC transporter ATP-binding protein [Xanthobacteraceae bacterium]
MSGIDSLAPVGDQRAFALLKRLFGDFGYRYRARYALAVVLMGLAAGCTALSAYLIGEVVDQAFGDRNMRRVVELAIIAIVLFATKGLATYGQAVVMARVSNAIVAENQRRMIARLLDQGLAFFDKRHSSEFLARLNAGAIAATQVLALVINAVGRDLLSLIGLVAVMVYQEPFLSLIVLIVTPPAVFFMRKLTKRARSVAQSQFVGSVRILETMQEMLQGIRIVKAFSLEDVMRRRAAGNIDEIERAANKMARVANRTSPLMETLGGFAIALVMLYSGYRAIEVNAAPGTFFSFITAFLLAYEPAKRLARFNIDLNAALFGVRVLFDLIDRPSGEPREDDKPPLKLEKARVAFNAVRFAYRPGEPILREVSFVAEPGRLTALVGPSGGGKSTILALLMRFYAPEAGTILIDGQDIAAVSRDSLRRAIAYVGQDVFLFRGTIRDNIAFGRPGATQAEIVAAAEAAFAHEFIMGFPAGYDTEVGEHGLQLSGGQRQRIAIARGLIKNAPLILLDEPTASLDSEAERQVHDAIARLTAGRTTLMIAHRLHTIAHADRILVIEDGTVVESGRHEELLRRGGRYASFYRLQLQKQGEQAAEPRAASSRA